MLELLLQIVAVLGSQWRSSLHITHWTVARLAGWYAPLPIPKNNQPDGHRGTSGIWHGLRKHSLVERITRRRQHCVIRRQIGRVTRRKSLGDALHHGRSTLPRSKILHLFPERRPVLARQVGKAWNRAEALFAMTVIAAPRQQQSAESVAPGNNRQGFLRPGHVRRDANQRFTIFPLRGRIRQ